MLKYCRSDEAFKINNYYNCWAVVPKHLADMPYIRPSDVADVAGIIVGVRDFLVHWECIAGVDSSK